MDSPGNGSDITQGAVRWQATRHGVHLTETTHPGHLALPEHRHREAALSLVLGGTFEERVAGDRFDCAPLSLLYKPAGAPHSNRFGASGARTLLVSLDGSVQERLEAVVGGGPDRAVRLAGSLPARALALYAATFSDGACEEVDWEELFAAVLQWGATRVEADAGEGDAGESRRPPWLERVDEMVHHRFAEPLRLSLLAEEVAVHPVHLARVHRRFHGCSLGRALRRRRIEHAVRRLRDPEPPDLAALALECGFADQSHFSRCFRREVGTSPARFRRRALGLLAAPGDGTVTG